MPAPIPFRTLFHADWSAGAKKRWVASASRMDAGWQVTAPRLVGDTRAFVDELFAAPGPLLAGFDFPIGLPSAYARRGGFADFPTALELFGQGEWAEFFLVAATPEEVSLKRPFYPGGPPKGTKQRDLLQGLGIADIAALFRQCDHATSTRQAACPLFWTVGAKQVGKAAISGWQEVIAPARGRGARLWPFDGSLAELAIAGVPVLAETYPAEAYAHVGAIFSPGMSKRRQGDRRAASASLSDGARRHGVHFGAELASQIADGFGGGEDGEDAFDALIGVLSMIEIVEGRRLERPSLRDDRLACEGWILGQAG